MCRTLPVVVALLALVGSGPAPAAEPSFSELVAQARAAHSKGQPEEARKLADRAVDARPTSREALSLRAVILGSLGEHAAAAADYTRLIEIGPESARLYDARGGEHFKAGRIAESIADFNRAIELSPQLAWGHWQRGISFYYAGRFDDGRRQFEAYQMTDDNDVENAVWRFLCMARAESLEAARKDLLKIRDDPRVPMMKIYALYAGSAQSDEVLAAARAGNPSPEELNRRLFYAHLYLGLYFEAAGDKKLAAEHMTTAQEHRIKHYMWDVARVHAQMLRASPAP